MAQDERTAFYTALCEQLYNPKSPAEREQIQAMLEYSFPTFADNAGGGIATSPPPPGRENSPTFAITSPTDTASALRILLENSPNPYVQTFCLARLKQLVLAQFSLFTNETKLQLRTFVLEYAFMHPDLQQFVITQLAGVFALLTRFGWLDLEEYHHVLADIRQFLQASVEHRIVGLNILAIIIQDINAPTSPRNSAAFRKAAASFRDTQLLPIFETAYDTLTELLHRTIPFDNPSQEERMRLATLKVLIRCLSYDFVGTSIDESGQDSGTVQIPATWRSHFEDDRLVPTLYRAYCEFPAPISAKAMECLVQVAAVRKALFNAEAERTKFVRSIMQVIRDTILSAQGMNDVDNYNEFCRLLYRFREAASLAEVTHQPDFVEWADLIASFTLNAIQSWKWAPNTSTYLLGFWQKVLQSMSYQSLGEEATKKIQSISIEVACVYVSTNVSSVEARLEEALDDPLENEDGLFETLKQLGDISRCKYQESSAGMMSVFDPIASQYQELLQQAQSGMIGGDALKTALEVIEVKLAWLVYAIAAFVGSRPSFLSSDELDAIDGELTSKVLLLMNINETLQSQQANAFLNTRLELAIVFFFSQFRKSYIADTTGKAIYTKLSDMFGISNQVDMLELIMGKIIRNLKYWALEKQIITRTLELFAELASGYSALRSLRKTENTQLILQNHTSGEFAFLEHEVHRQNRMLYYQTLNKVLFADDIGEDELLDFMKPFDMRLAPLEELSSIDAFRQEPVRRALQDIFRDLRGFITPIQNRRNFTLFFDWFYPAHMPLLLHALEAWSPDPVANTLLKFFAELVFNKSQRLNFDVSSANGILLFRDASRVLSTYGRLILEQQQQEQQQQPQQQQQPHSDKYKYKYKGIGICFDILAHCLAGRYINFGVFWLYGDKAIDEAFQMMFQLMLSIPLDDLMGFPKLTRKYINMLDEFAREQLTSLPTLSPDTFLYMMQSCEQAVESGETYVRSHACSAISHIGGFVIRETERRERRQRLANEERRPSAGSTDERPMLHWLTGCFEQFPQILPSLLVTVFNLVLFDENGDQWALSRPLYVLMLLQKEYCMEYTRRVIDQQLPERREFVTKAMNKLMGDVTWTMSTKNRERFTQNVSSFRRELASENVVLVPVRVY